MRSKGDLILPPHLINAHTLPSETLRH